jgi:hypothetical protein
MRDPAAAAANWTPTRKETLAKRQRARERLIALARLMDSAIVLPGVRRGVGLDALLGLVPVAGDALSALIGIYSVMLARDLGASRWLQARMIGNLLADAALGAVPLAGDVADVFFRAHRRNLRLLQRELKEPWIEVEAESLPPPVERVVGQRGLRPVVRDR